MDIEEFSKSLLVDPLANTGENNDSNLLDSSTNGQFDMKFELVDDKLLQLEKNINLETLLNKNVDLVSYAVEVEKKVQLKENELVQQFLDNMPSIDELNESIQFCNNVLQKMDTILVAFNSKIVLINNEIKNLHSESKLIQLKLDNRMKLMSKLGKLMDEILIREDMIETLYSPDITDKYIDEIIKLDKILYNSNQLLKKKQSIKSLNQILTESERLRLKTADTIRHYFLSHYNLIPNTMCNLTKLQQKKLLPKLKLNQFIIERHLGVATECAQHYINNVSGYYASHFDYYARELLKLKLPIQDKSELIGNLESKSFVLDIPLFNQSKQFTQQKVNYYVMGDRVKIFDNLTYSPIIIQNAKELNLKYTFEALFKSFNYALVNSLITEYTFLTQFFGQKTSGKGEGEEENDLMSDVIFKKVFESVFKIGLDFIKTLLDNNHDIIGQLICIQLNLEFQTQLKEFKIELEEFYFNDLRILIWPSIQSSINAHIHSLRRLGAGLNSVDVESHHHHFITRRYSEFSLSLLILNQRQEDQMLTNSLYRLKSEFLNFLQIYQQKIKLIKNKFIFLINNYNLILINYQDYLNLNLVKAEYQIVEGLLNQNIEEFINEEINYNFNDLVALMEPVIEGKISVEQISSDKLIKLNNSLKTSWEPNLIKFKSLILKKISNFTLLEIILKNFLTKFLLLYSNFLNCWELKFIKNSSGGGNTGGLQEAPVDLQKVMIVIKRLKDNF